MAKRKRRRDLQKEAVWRGRVADQSESGMSVRGYCRSHDLSEPCFHWWKRELRRRDDTGFVGKGAENGGVKSGMAFTGKRKRTMETSPVSFAEIQVVADAKPERVVAEAGAERINEGSGPDSICRDEPRVEREADANRDNAIEVCLYGGRRIRVVSGFDEKTFLRVVALLDGVGRC